MNEATAGAALKYHIKRALERSHTISDFSKQLELSAKNAKFSNNTLKIIEELNNGVKQASEEIKEKATKYEKALQELQKIDESKLTKEQKQVLKVFKGELDQTEIKGIDLNDLYILEQGSRNAGARKILRKHYGEENTGGLTNEELLNMSEVIKNGSVLLESFERIKNGFRYAYEWDNNGVKLRLVVDDLNNGNKIFDFYSDRNFKDFRDASLHSGNHPYKPNPTQKPLTDQEELLKTSENLNETTKEAKNLSPLEQANAEKLLKLQHAITPLKEFGKNYPEFALKPKEALEKLLQEQNGQVAGAAFREDLGGIDFVWGTPKTKDSNGYGLAHILERREQQALSDGLNEAEAKEYALNIVKSIPEIIEKGSKGTDHLGRVFVDYGNKRVGLNNTWDNKDLENHWVISSYELRNTTEKPTHFPTSQAITKEKDIHSLNSVGPNPTTNPLKTQDLSPLELAKERTNELLKQIPEVIEKGIKDDDYIGHARYNDDIEVGLSSQKGNTPLKNHYMITSFERDEKVLRKLETIATLSNDYRDGINYSTSNLNLRELETRSPLSNDYKGNSNHSALNLNEPNLTPKSLTSQEELLKTTENPLKTTQTPLSPLEQANAEKLAKLESEKLESEKEFLTSHQIFLKEAKGNATNQINKTESLEAIGQAREQAKNEINTAKKTDHYQRFF